MNAPETLGSIGVLVGVPAIVSGELAALAGGYGMLQPPLPSAVALVGYVAALGGGLVLVRGGVFS